jgi:glycosyltransferase A (GT-A) superfamily protein (DUF2064 family)
VERIIGTIRRECLDHVIVLNQASLYRHVKSFLEASGHLGDRIYAAVRDPLAAGRPKVVILGSDSPGLPASHIQTLLASRADIALGPAEDGGFYAIACSRTDPAMFDAVHWSTCSALEDTVQAARRCGLTLELGPAWFDVDRPEDLARLR